MFGISLVYRVSTVFTTTIVFTVPVVYAVCYRLSRWCIGGLYVVYVVYHYYCLYD
jgi:hypothetical protein